MGVYPLYSNELIGNIIVCTESIKNILGKNVKIIERRAVRLETKGDKTENRILVSHTFPVENFQLVKL